MHRYQISGLKLVPVWNFVLSENVKDLES